MSIGLLSIGLLFSIDNVYYATIEMSAKRPFFSTEVIQSLLVSTFKGSFVFIVALLEVFLINFNRIGLLLKVENRNKLIYVLFSFLWLVFSLLSMSRQGGNEGNLEVGLIVFMPFVIAGMHRFLSNFYTQKYLYYLIISILIVGLAGVSYQIHRYSIKLFNKIAQDEETIIFLTKNFKEMPALVSGGSLVLASVSGLDVVTDFDTAGHFFSTISYQNKALIGALDKKVYDIIWLTDPYNIDYPLIQDSIIANYQEYSDFDLPKHLKGKVFIPRQLN